MLILLTFRRNTLFLITANLNLNLPGGMNDWVYLYFNVIHFSLPVTC